MQANRPNLLSKKNSPKRINILRKKRKSTWAKKYSNGWFRSSVLRVMSPARFRCATLLDFQLLMIQFLDDCELILLYKTILNLTVYWSLRELVLS